MEIKRTRRIKALIWWTLSTLWLTLTVYLSNQVGTGSAALSQNLARSIWTPLLKLFPELDFEEFHIFVRKLAHFGVHMILAFSIFRASNYTFRRKGTALFITLILAGFIAFANELVQLRAPGRVWTIVDTGLNLLGVFIGTCLSGILP